MITSIANYDDAPRRGSVAEPLDLTVLIVNDFAGKEKNWRDEVRAVNAFLRQDVGRTFRIVIAESEDFRDAPVPNALTSLSDKIEIAYFNETRSAQLKDAGVGAVKTEWVLVIDADCEPNAGFVRNLIAAVEKYPDFDYFISRAHYGLNTPLRRAASMFDRHRDNECEDRRVYYVPGHGFLARTNVAKRFRAPNAPTPFLATPVRQSRILSGGAKVRFVGDAVADHEFSLGFIWDFNRELGFASYLSRRESHGHSALRVLGSLQKAMFKTFASRHRDFLRWTDYPIALALQVFAIAPMLYGIWEAASGRIENRRSHFR
ncbi:MAG: glycosyltransferase [Pseudomonadota bacterium]